MTIGLDDDSPRYVGDTWPPSMITFQTRQGIVPLGGLDETKFTMILTNDENPDLVKYGAGPWTITDSNNGVAQYNYLAADTDTAGLWHRRVQVHWPGGRQTFRLPDFTILYG